jgi:5-carboxymethyl-2-hydroxymuconate isomerase
MESRNTQTFKKKFKTRTSVERSNKRILVDYNIEAGRCRSSKQRFARATFAAINIHLDAWVKHTGFSIINHLAKRIIV